MWSQICLCLLVGLAYATENPAWNDQSHYLYQVRARSFASLNQISNDYSGVVLKAELDIQPKKDGSLGARILNAQYAKVHAKLDEGWEMYIPDSELNYQNLPLSDKPFQINLYKGVVRNIVVSKQLKNWEANMVKSIVSQLQLDTKATNLIPSSINILTQDSNTAVFKTMEETVTGVAETLYEIHPYPEYVLQTRPWMAPHKHLVEQGEMIEVVKNKNFTHTSQTPSYHAGLEGISGYHPGNKIADFLSRTSVSQAVISGSLEQFTIQSSVTVEEIVLSPTLGDEQKGSVNSKLNVTLSHVSQPQDDSSYQVDNGVEVGVVYAYDDPFGTDNSPRPAKDYDHNVDPASAETYSDSRSFLRSRPRRQDDFAPDSPYSEYWHQDMPQLNEAPPNPLLPFTVGYDGQSIKKQQNIIETVRRLAEDIGQDFPHPKKVLEEHTVSKYVTLTSLVRIMDQNEVEQVASQLYTPQESIAWTVYRDAVAQAGTGPAISSIKNWIQKKQVSDFEAAKMIAVAAYAARQPTEEYMKFFNGMLQDNSLMERPYLNSSIILSYTNLVRQVYVNEQESKAKYPVYTYGTFRSSRGQEYVKNDIIPYLTRKLNEAINKADTHKIHTYIRALGNTGHQAILEAYEPYLEGQRKASHFQRVLMVISLDQLVKSNPKVARSVLYKIYQNPSEAEPVRVAAVYQLMRTRVSSTMLQRMAAYTNVDPSNYVNAAVKSTIESAAKLELAEHHGLRTAAESAKPLLTSQEYGYQYSHGYLRSYVMDEPELTYEEYVQTFGGQDHHVPKGIKYNLQKQFGGVNHYVINAQAIVSSVEDLVNVYEQQTKEYQREQQEKRQQESPKYPWSSEFVAKVLNLQNEQREQLEGNFYLQLGALHSLYSFDNLTVENLAYEIDKLENELKGGKPYECKKLLIGQESSLAFPTALGLPFVYTYDLPLFINHKAEIKATAKPPIAAGDSLQKPDTVAAEFDIQTAVSGRIQTEFGIFTPFDHQRYTAGYHKIFQVVFPLTGKFDVNLRKHQLALQVQNPASQESVKLLHYSAWPYTSQNDIYAPKPTLKIIHSDNPYKRNVVLGDKSTGVAVFVHTTSDERLDLASLYEKFKDHDFVSALLTPWPNQDIQYIHVDIGIDAGRSTTQQIYLRLGYQTDYQQNDPTDPKPDPNQQISDIPVFAEDPEKRQKEFVDKVGDHINNAEVMVMDATVEFQGQSRIKYSFTTGMAKSNVDPQSRFIALAKKTVPQEPQTSAYVQAVSKVPNTNGLNLDYAMQMDPSSEIYLQGLLRHKQRLSKVDAHIDLSKSDERVQYLQQQDDYEECKRQMQHGDYQLPICAKVTSEANLLDKFSIKMKYSDMDSHVINATYKLYSELRHLLYPRIEENIESQAIDRFDIEGKFSPDLEYVNASISSAYGRAEIKNAPVSRWARQLLVPHPVFHTPARLVGEALKYDTYRPICVVDKTHMSTFDNKTYAGSLPSTWAVLLQYIPRRPSPVLGQPDQSVPEQLEQTVESYGIYVMAAQQGSPDKEIQIVLQMPSTQGKIVKIGMKPSRQGKGPTVLVNGQQVKYDSQSSSDFYNGAIQVYALPNKEVKVEVRGAFYIIFNSQTIKLTAVNSKFRDSSRGLCGTFTGEEETDFLAPNNCIIHDPQEFIESYTVNAQPRLARRIPSKSELQGGKCYHKKVNYANYISNQDAGRSSDYERRSGGDCTGHLSRYIEGDGEICFTIRALPYCKSGCSPLQMTPKAIDVHCLEPSANTAFWRSQIDKSINQDFTMMQPSKKLTMHVPSRCLPN